MIAPSRTGATRDVVGRLRRQPAVRWMLLTAAFALVASYAVGPALRSPFHLLPAGRSTSATVPMFNAWTIWWNADRLSRGLVGYWDAPIFHPVPGAFAFSEPQPATWAVAPLVWLTGSPMPAYHAYLIASLALNGLFAVRLLRWIGAGWSQRARRTASVAGGTAVLLLPIVHEQLDILQLVPLWAVLWTLLALLQLARGPTWQRGLELGVATSAVFMISIHHGLFLALLLTLTGWTTMALHCWRRWLAGVGAAILTAAALLTPLLWPMHEILGRHEFRRSERSVAALSARPSDWLQVPPEALFGGADAAQTAAGPLMPGWLRGTLALVAVVLLLVSPAGAATDRRAVLLLTVLTSAAMLFSLGLNLQLGGWQPWRTLCHWATPFAHVRSVFRFAYFAQLGIVLLAAIGLGSLQHHLANARAPAGRRRWLRGVLLALAAIMVAVEVPPSTVRAVGVPEVARPRPWTTYLRRHTPPGRAVACLPFDRGYAADDFDATARWMLYGTQHQIPMVNGYSGFFPESWFQMTRLLARRPLRQAALAALADADVEFVVLQRHQISIDQATDGGPFRLHPVFRDPSGIDIYRLQRPSPARR